MSTSNFEVILIAWAVILAVYALKYTWKKLAAGNHPDGHLKPPTDQVDRQAQNNDTTN